jgi:hypothetical protein
MKTLALKNSWALYTAADVESWFAKYDNCGVADEKEYHDILLDHYKRWEILRARSERMLGQIKNTPFYSRHPLLILGRYYRMKSELHRVSLLENVSLNRSTYHSFSSSSPPTPNAHHLIRLI